MVPAQERKPRADAMRAGHPIDAKFARGNSSARLAPVGRLPAADVREIRPTGSGHPESKIPFIFCCPHMCPWVSRQTVSHAVIGPMAVRKGGWRQKDHAEKGRQASDLDHIAEDRVSTGQIYASPRSRQRLEGAGVMSEIGVEGVTAGV